MNTLRELCSPPTLTPLEDRLLRRVATLTGRTYAQTLTAELPPQDPR